MDGGTTGSASPPRSQRCEVSRPTRPARGVVDPARCRHPRERTQGKQPSSTAGRSGPPSSGSLAAEAAGSSVAGSSRPRALIRRRQRLTDKLRLSTLVILSRPAPQPAPGDSAVALPTTTAFTGIVCAPEPSGDTAPRHIPCSTSLRAFPACRAVWLDAPGNLNLAQPPRVAPASRSKSALIS